MCFKHPLLDTRNGKYVMTREMLDRYFEIDTRYLRDEIKAEEMLKEYYAIDKMTGHPEVLICLNYNEELFRYCLCPNHVSAMKKLLSEPNAKYMWIGIIGRTFCWFSVAPDRTAEEIETFLRIIIETGYPVEWWNNTSLISVCSTVECLKEQIIASFVISGSGYAILKKPEVFGLTKEELDIKNNTALSKYYSEIERIKREKLASS